jgi:eukaryotic-like serine/threonine-protein kinase
LEEEAAVLAESGSITIGGRYELCAELASGGMATVHLARQLGAAGFARIVAVKRLHERYSRDPDFVAMFLDEARIVARIRHPNVVQTIDVVAEEGELFLVMEYVHGESLLRITRTASKANAPLPVPVVRAILVGALHGLHEAHEAASETGEALGIVHRDVSPHNILVGIDGVARVLDFGVAQASQRIQSTLDGQLKGKLSYMAPEQLTNRPLDRRVDVYAAGVVLWEALAGTKLFVGESEGAVVNKILFEPVPVPSAANPAVSGALDAIVMRALSRDASERFATAREMALALERAAPVASLSEVGDLVTRSCAASISSRREIIAAIESRASSSNLREAVDSLRSLALSRGDSSKVSGAMALTPASNGPETRGSAGIGADLPRPRTLPLAVPTTPRHLGVPHVHHVPVPSAHGRARGRALGAVAAAAALVLVVVAASGYLFLARGKRAPAAVADVLDASVESGTRAAAGAMSASALPAPAASCPAGMALVPGGRFFMGSDEDLPAERPAHKVTLRAYCMDKLEVTTDAYRACSDRGDCKRAGVTNKWDDLTPKDSRTYDPLCNAGAADGSRGAHPINCVEWTMADRFCKAEGKRLPTEAEWEFAARGSDGRKYPWGDAAPSVLHLNACGAECTAWGKKHGAVLEGLFAESDPWPTTAPVGSFPLGISRWGIDDLVGNVWEWVADYYAPYGDADQDDPSGAATGVTRAMRGGSWNGAYADWVRPSFRFHNPEATRSHGVGFRCAKTL